MAFMMPIVKNDYNVYPSCPSSRAGSGTPQSRGSSLSSSPSAASSFVGGSPRHSQTPAFQPIPKSGSQNSLQKFHCKLLDKLKKTFRSGKDDNPEEVQNHPSSSGTAITLR